MVRRSRGGARARSRAAAATPRTPTPVDQSDDEMQDAPTEQATPQEEEGIEDRDEDIEDEGEDAASTPAAEPEEPTSRLRARASPAVPVRRRPGRPPKRPVDWDAADPDRTPSETPKRRGGFRGGSAWRGGRWKNRGQQHVTQVPLDKDGNMANIVNDEVELPEDPDGETKVDKDGYLKDGREYRVRTFTVAEKGDRLYMLSTEPARCIGFRDSYLFFQKHRQLFKIILSDDAKKDLIERDLIPHSYKGRAIGVVTARSVFREFGAKIIIGGRKVIDDYQVAQVKLNGDVEGELAVPEDQHAAQAEEYDRNRYVAWHGASAVYHSTVPNLPLTMEKPGGQKKRRVQVTGSNWMLEHARAASRFNSALAQNRRQNLNGTYDIYTNQMLYPAIMQHTHAKWEVIPPPTTTDTSVSTPNANSPPALTNGFYSTSSSSSSEAIPTPPSTSGLPTANPTATTNTASTTTTTTLPDGTLLHTTSSLTKPLPTIQYNNALTVDTYIRYPSNATPNLGYPGPDGPTFDLGAKGLSEVDPELTAMLPPECKQAFDEALSKEKEWREYWGTEQIDGMRDSGVDEEELTWRGGVMEQLGLMGSKVLKGSYNSGPI